MTPDYTFWRRYSELIADSSRKYKVPIVIGISFIVFISLWLVDGVTVGGNLHWDEYFTLERSIGFSKFNDWFHVYSNNLPTAKKPPLQYWITAISFNLGMPQLLALRFFSLICSIGLLIVVGLISHKLCNNTWAGLSSMILLCCSTMFVVSARSGMLDAGMSFLLMLSILFLLKAKDNPKYWVYCGLSIGLGAIQKTPVAFLAVSILLIILSLKNEQKYHLSSLTKNKEFIWGLLIMMFLLLVWPLLQMVTLGFEYLTEAYGNQMVRRFSPVASDGWSVNFNWFLWLIKDWGAIALLSLLCLLAALFCKRWRENTSTFALSVLTLLFLISFSTATGILYSRYIMIILPLLVIITVKVLNDILPSKVFLICIAVLFFSLSFGKITNGKKRIMLDVPRNDYFTVQAHINNLDKYSENCSDIIIERRVAPPGAYGFFGKRKVLSSSWNLSKDRHVKALSSMHASGVGDIIGITKLENTNILNQIFDEYIILDQTRDTIVWKYNRPIITR